MIDFSKYVNPFRQPKSYSLGPSIRAVIEQNQNQQRIDQQESQYARTRSDTQATTAAEFAAKRGDTTHKAAADRYQQRLKLVDEATQAAQNGDYNTARALRPRILELGGEATESGNPANPVFRFKAGDEPARAPIDIAGARSQLYGPSGPSASSPFQVPGFGANGQRNPMDPPALPGAAAASMPQSAPAPGSPAPPAGAPPDAGPLPGKATEGYPGREGMVPPDGAPPPPMEQPASTPPVAQPEQPSSPQLTGPNPLDPYTIDTSAVQLGNERQLEPFFRGLKNAVPNRFSSQVDQFGQGARALRMSPAATLTAAKPWFSELSGYHRGELASEAQSGAADLRKAQRESMQDNKDRDDARKVVSQVIRTESLTKVKDKLSAVNEARNYAKEAETNGQVANALIESLYRMKNTGVMTDVDFTRSEKGIQGLVGAIKDGVLQQFVSSNGGLHPGMLKRINELINLSEKSHRDSLLKPLESMYRAWKGAKKPIQKDVYEESIRINFPEEYWPKEFSVDPTEGGGDFPSYSPDEEQGAMQDMAAQEGGVVDNVGVVPLPGQRNMPRDSRRPGEIINPKLGPKPLRKPPAKKRIIDSKSVDDMTVDEMNQAVKELEEEARQGKK